MARVTTWSTMRQAPLGEEKREGDSRGRWSPITICALLLTLLLAATQILVWAKAIEARGGPEQYVRGIDLMPTIAAGVAIRDGTGASLYDFGSQLAAQRQVRAPYLSTDEIQLLPYIHPPFEALVIVPFLNLPYSALYGAITVLALGAIGASLWLLARELPVRGAGKWVLIAALCSYHPLYQALWLGQTSPFVLLGICGTYAALTRHRVYWAVPPLLLIALKPQVFLVFALLIILLGYWRTVAIAIAAGLAACLATIPFLGLLWPLRYATFLAAIAGWDVPHAVYPASMPTLRGLTVNLLGGIAPQIASIVATLLALLALSGLVWSWWRTRALLTAGTTEVANWAPQRDWLWALAAIVAVLVPAHMGPHDHTILIFPAWIIAHNLLAGQWGRGFNRLWLVLLWAIYCVMLLLPFSESPGVVVIPSVTLLIIGASALIWLIQATPITPRTDQRAAHLRKVAA